MMDEHIGLYTLLKEFDAICRKHHIVYYLEGGSLLGAVRHRGFLPWDDDVDLCMNRDNWHKLLSVIDDELAPNRELYCYERFPNYLRETVKYTNLDSTVIFPNHILDGNACGQHIDLFIMDPAPNDPRELEEYRALAHVYSELMTPVYVMCEGIAGYSELYAKYKAIMDEKGREYTLNLIREKLYSIPDDDTVTTYYLRWGNNHRFFEKDFFGEPIDLPFEDQLFPAPSKYYRFLRAEFGDSWMMVPEEAAQVDHKTYDNYTVPCRVFMADYTPFIDFGKAESRFKSRKALNLEKLAYTQKNKQNTAQMACLLREMELGDMLHGLTGEQKNLLATRDYPALAGSLTPYVEAQLSAELYKNGMALPVVEEVLYAASLSYTMTGRFSIGEKLLLVNKGKVTSPRLEELSELILATRSCMLAGEEERYQDGIRLCETFLAKYPGQFNMEAYLVARGIDSGADGASLSAKLETLSEINPESDEVMKLWGDLLTREGKGEEAEAWYKKCASVTHNGLYCMELSAYLPRKRG